MTLTRGLRNNNPGNIRKGGDVFQGEIIPSSDKAFKQFKTMAYGYRAMFVTLDTYRKRGANTVEKIINLWAPPSENNTGNYIKVVCTKSGLTPTRALNEYSGAEYKRIVAAMSLVENGHAANLQDVEYGFGLQDRIK
jgi:hypothetical protein